MSDLSLRKRTMYIGTIFFAHLALWLLALSFLASCASAHHIKSEIATDLIGISELNDCPTTCEALKLYIRTKLGGL